MLNVVCVKWGTIYGLEYVENLHDMVQRHLTVAFRFQCFTDDPLIGDPFWRRTLSDVSLPGWWNKLWLFNKTAFRAGERVLFFDLDTAIIANIDAIATCQEEFACLRDFYRPRGLGSGVMLWEAGKMDHVWEDFVADGCPMLSGGDQAYIEIETHRRWGHDIGPNRILQNLFPGMFVSYKGIPGTNGEAELLAGPPADAAVVCFHGQPKPHNCGADWIKDHWCVKASHDVRTPSAA